MDAIHNYQHFLKTVGIKLSAYLRLGHVAKKYNNRK